LITTVIDRVALVEGTRVTEDVNNKMSVGEVDCTTNNSQREKKLMK